MDPHELPTMTLLTIDHLTNCNENCVSLYGNSIVLRIYIMACQAGLLCCSCKNIEVLFVTWAQKVFSVKPQLLLHQYIRLSGFRNEDSSKAIFELNPSDLSFIVKFELNLAYDSDLQVRKNLYHNVDMQERGFIVRNRSHEVEVIHELCKLVQGDASQSLLCFNFR